MSLDPLGNAYREGTSPYAVPVFYNAPATMPPPFSPRYGSVPPTLAECDARLAVIATEMAKLNDALGRLRGERERLHSRRDQLT
jgi:hypothetical protein